MAGSQSQGVWVTSTGFLFGLIWDQMPTLGPARVIGQEEGETGFPPALSKASPSDLETSCVALPL